MFGIAGSTYAQQAAPAAQAAPSAEQQQQQDAQSLQSITVVGIRRSIESAVAAKKNSDMIVDTISSEDIGKLPDDSIADALTTLPGVAAQPSFGPHSETGRASLLSIRGFSGDFTNALFNGRELASTYDSRAVPFDQFPAELINAVTVYKTPDATLIGQGLAGTVDLRTLLPLDFNQQVVQAKAMGSRTSLDQNPGEVNRNGDRLSASYIDQFANRTIGVSLGYVHLDSPSQDQQLHSWGYGNGPTQAPGFPTATSSQGDEFWANTSSNVRDGVMGVFQYKPSKDFSTVVDAFYSRYSENDFDTALQFGTNYANVTNGAVNGINYLSSGNNMQLGGGSAYSGAPVLRDEFDSENDTTSAIGWKTTFKADKWTFTTDLSESRATARQQTLEMYSGVFQPVFGSFTSNPFTGMNLSNTSVNLANPSTVLLGDPSGWGQDGYDKFPVTTDRVKELRLDAKRNLDNDVFDSVTFGVNYTDREKSNNTSESFIDFASGYKTASGQTTTAAVPAGAIVGPITLPNGPTMLGLNPLALLSSGLFQFVPQNNIGDVYAKNWEVDEKVSTAFAQLHIDSQIGTMPLRGNVGVQFVHTNQSSDAIESVGVGSANASGEAVAPITGGATYNNWLPSLNLVASLPYDQVLRLGIGEGIERAPFTEMSASNEVTFSSTSGLFSSSAGNPALRPTLSDALDVSYEKYFGTKGYVAVTPYYKYLRTYIYQEAELYNFAGYPTTSGAAPTSPYGVATQWVNGNGGSMKGIELTVNVPLEMATPALHGFGVFADASRGSSSIQTNVNGTTSESAFPGFSASTANWVLYYESDSGFAVRWKENYRSTFLGQVGGFADDLVPSQFLGYHTDNIELSYDFRSGPMKGMTLLFQGLNLNNPAIVQTGGTNQPMSQIDRTGRTYMLGVNYKM
jgi:iron complex outermembrane receptor protein